MRIAGIVHQEAVRDRGLTSADLRRLLRIGTVSVVGTWYVTEQAPQRLVGMLRDGVRPTCVTAAVYHGLWSPLVEGVHVYRPRRRNRLPSHAAYVDHTPTLGAWPDRDPVPPLPLVLEHAGRCLPVRDAAILLESAVNSERISMEEATMIVESLPVRTRTPLRRIKSDAQSGTETAVRWWLESARVPVASQMWIPGVGHVDLLVGRSWIIECDSRRYHDTHDQYHRDRARDLRLRALGYVVTRLTWEQVFVFWSETERILREVLRRRDHRRALPGAQE